VVSYGPLPVDYLLRIAVERHQSRKLVNSEPTSPVLNAIREAQGNPPDWSQFPTVPESEAKCNRIPYDKFETEFLKFFSGVVDWKAVAGASESEEVKDSSNELNEVLGELDRTTPAEHKSQRGNGRSGSQLGRPP
jgi:hypothetical protein